MKTKIQKNALASALAKCCDANPSAGPGRKLHPDASAMADVLGVMIARAVSELDAESVSTKSWEAFERWKIN